MMVLENRRDRERGERAHEQNLFTSLPFQIQFSNHLFHEAFPGRNVCFSPAGSQSTPVTECTLLLGYLLVCLCSRASHLRKEESKEGKKEGRKI